MMKPRILILLNFLAVAAFLQIIEFGGWGRSHNHLGVAYGRPFAIVERGWTCDWDSNWDPAGELEYDVSFSFTSLLKNAAIIGAVALASWFLWRKVRPTGPTWGKVACWVYVLTALSLLTSNVCFAVANYTNVQVAWKGPVRGDCYRMRRMRWHRLARLSLESVNWAARLQGIDQLMGAQ